MAGTSRRVNADITMQLRRQQALADSAPQPDPSDGGEVVVVWAGGIISSTAGWVVTCSLCEPARQVGGRYPTIIAAAHAAGTHEAMHDQPTWLTAAGLYVCCGGQAEHFSECDLSGKRCRASVGVDGDEHLVCEAPVVSPGTFCDVHELEMRRLERAFGAGAGRDHAAICVDEDGSIDCVCGGAR